jgi:hypothetical protein
VLGGQGVTRLPRTELLIMPDAEGEPVRRLERDTPVQIMGAVGRYYRVQLEDGVAGYVTARALGRTRRAPEISEVAASPAAAVPTSVGAR